MIRWGNGVDFQPNLRTAAPVERPTGASEARGVGNQLRALDHDRLCCNQVFELRKYPFHDFNRAPTNKDQPADHSEGYNGRKDHHENLMPPSARTPGCRRDLIMTLAFQFVASDDPIRDTPARLGRPPPSHRKSRAVRTHQTIIHSIEAAN